MLQTSSTFTTVTPGCSYERNTPLYTSVLANEGRVHPSIPVRLTTITQVHDLHSVRQGYGRGPTVTNTTVNYRRGPFDSAARVFDPAQPEWPQPTQSSTRSLGICHPEGL